MQQFFLRDVFRTVSSQFYDRLGSKPLL